MALLYERIHSRGIKYYYPIHMTRRLLISCRTASTRWDMRLLVKLLSRTHLTWQLEASDMFSVLKLETLLSHTAKITEVKNESVSLRQ